MLPYAYYLLKVIICSGILLGYYWCFLRNKSFHAWNRFYLLTAIVLSLLLPLVKINFWEEEGSAQNSMIRMLQVVSDSDEYLENIVISTSIQNRGIEQLYPILYFLVSLTLFIVLVHTLFTIARMLQKYPVQRIDSISLVNTDAKGTPFSFLKYIFWNHHIDMETASGKQIFKHELTHIQERHTYDKLFVNIVLIGFWCNPFFWLIRKELNMIHEFIADKKAVEDSDTAAFAEMILQATYPQHRFQVANNFFYSPIKRRLNMLSKNNTRFSYFARILVLPLAVFIIAAFTFKSKQLTPASVATGYPSNHLFSNSVRDTVPVIKISESKTSSRPAKTNARLQPAAIALDKMNVLYVGVDNPITVAAPDVAPKDLSLEISAGSIQGGNGKYTVRVTTPGNVTISVYNKSSGAFISSSGFRVQLLPDPANGKPVPGLETSLDNEPKAYLGNIGGYRPDINEFRAQKEIRVSPGYSFHSATLYFLGKGFDNNVVSTSINSKSLSTIEEFMMRCQPGSSIVFDKVKVKDKAGNIKEVPMPPAYIIVESKTQNNVQADPDNKIFTKVEIGPEFPGGQQAWKKYLTENLNPSVPVNEGWKPGTYQVLVRFIVKTDGSLTDVTTTNYRNSKTAQQCINIIKSGPKWLPAVQNGKKVNAYRNQPITFVIEEN